MRDAETFAADLADYINQFIVGMETTKIESCEAPGDRRNRGHIIQIKVVMPEELADGKRGAGMVFYAEELMEEFPSNTVESIGEIVNVRVNEHYDACIQTIIQSEAMKTPIDGFDLDKLYLTAVPESLCKKEEYEPFITKKEKDLGLILYIRAEIHHDGENGYLSPIMKNEGDEAEEHHWEAARTNSLQMAKVDLAMMRPVSMGLPPMAGFVVDKANFYDFFYLLELEGVWSGAKDTFAADKIYIIPDSAHTALFLLDNEDIRKDPEAVEVQKTILSMAAEDQKANPVPIFVLDCDTMELARYEE